MKLLAVRRLLRILYVVIRYRLDDLLFALPLPFWLRAPRFLLPWRWVPRSGYLKRLYQAHRLHHAVHGREGCVSFGFLWAPAPARLKQRLQEVQRIRRDRRTPGT